MGRRQEAGARDGMIGGTGGIGVPDIMILEYAAWPGVSRKNCIKSVEIRVILVEGLARAISRKPEEVARG